MAASGDPARRVPPPNPGPGSSHPRNTGGPASPDLAAPSAARGARRRLVRIQTSSRGFTMNRTVIASLGIALVAVALRAQNIPPVASHAMAGYVADESGRVFIDDFNADGKPDVLRIPQ